MWDYTPFLLTLVPAAFTVAMTPSLLVRRLFGRFLVLTLVIWLVASIVFTALLIPLEPTANAPSAERYLRLFLMVSVVVSIPVAVAAASQFILIRQRVATIVSSAIATLASSATILVLPPVAMFAACAIVDPSCI
jgi:hypothetical protein